MKQFQPTDIFTQPVCEEMFPSGVNIVKNMTVLDPELCNTASTENRVGWEKP